ncbi:lipocalin-like domain-containing protein [Dawidia soli]|uniref:Lipocalin family protein n=1 Tax=Dawidia soli TaxID=2782352 RepID=A0AAP2DFD4_9BACT|nr:lipocalin family protein [Dawidia soli]MBT1690242.1 lipocalin family protein [Dawidia soli]
MKNIRQYLFGLMLVACAGTLSCEDDYESNSDKPGLELTIPGQNIKIAGYGQYRTQVREGSEAVVTVMLPPDVRALTITKSVNLTVDGGYGIDGMLAVDAAALSPGGEYTFRYVGREEDIDQLIGFAFRAETASGDVVNSDLTLAVAAAPRINLSRRKWMFTSKIWVNKGNKEDIRECEKDNYYLFHADGLMDSFYGTSHAGGCELEEFNDYDTWALSEDETTFEMKYHSIFSPDVFTTDVFNVKTLTVDKLELEIHIDLSWAGETNDEVFIYKYVAAPK